MKPQGEAAGNAWPSALPANENCTGLAQLARLGPTLWLKIPIRALKLAHNVGHPCTIFVTERSGDDHEVREDVILRFVVVGLAEGDAVILTEVTKMTAMTARLLCKSLRNERQ